METLSAADLSDSNNNQDHVYENTGVIIADEDLDMPMNLYSETPIISIQPRLTDDHRIAIPISTGEYHFIPLSGLDFLTRADDLYIQQTVELHDIVSVMESENRYLVKTSPGDTLYAAAETSQSCERQLCGSARGFTMDLLDQSKQHALRLRRPFACSQKIEVFNEQTGFIGAIKKVPTLLEPEFNVFGEQQQLIYHIKGPRHYPWQEIVGATFQVFGSDKTTFLTAIHHEWNNRVSCYNLAIKFPPQHIDASRKALLLGAMFLLEYVYFETAKRASMIPCCK